MHFIRTESDLQALEDPELLALIRLRIADTAEFVDDFSELVFFIVVQPGDDLATVDAALGFPVMANRFNGIAFGEPGFTPSWDVLEEHPGFYELVYVLSDDGQGVTVFVTRAEGVSAELLAMCREFSPLEAST
jgi:hypothetical protein